MDISNNKRIANNTILLSIRMVLVLILGLYTTRVTLSALGVEDYGIYNVVGGFVSMFTFLNISMSNGIQRYFNYELGRNGVEGARKVYITSIVIQLLVIIIILILTETLGLWYLHNKLVVPDDRLIAARCVYQISIFSFVLIVLQSPFNAAIMAHERMNFYAFISILDAILKLVIVLLIPYANCDLLILYSVLIAMISLMNLILAVVYSIRNFEEISFAPLFDKDLFKSMLSFSGWNIFGTFSNMMREQGINLILNLFFGPIVNAARGIAYQVTSGLQGFVLNLSTAIRPQLVQSYAKGNYSRTINLMFSLSKVSVCVFYIIAYPIILEINYVLNLWLDAKVPDNTSTFIIIVILITFVNNLNSAVSAVVHATGRMKAYQLIGSTINLLSIPFAYFVLKMGFEASSVFWVSFVFTLLMQFASLLVLRTIVSFTLKEYAKNVLLPFILLVLGSFIFPLIPYSCMSAGFLRFLVVLLVGLLSSCIVFYFVGLNYKEKDILKSLVLQTINRFKS